MSKKLEVTLSATVPDGMTAAHFRRLVLRASSPIWLSLHDQECAKTRVGKIRVKISGARKS